MKGNLFSKFRKKKSSNDNSSAVFVQLRFHIKIQKGLPPRKSNSQVHTQETLTNGLPVSGCNGMTNNSYVGLKLGAQLSM